MYNVRGYFSELKQTLDDLPEGLISEVIEILHASAPQTKQDLHHGKWWKRLDGFTLCVRPGKKYAQRRLAELSRNWVNR